MSKDRLGKAPRQLHVCLHGQEPTIPVSAARLIRVTARNSEHLFTKLVIFVQPYRAPVIRNVPKWGHLPMGYQLSYISIIINLFWKTKLIIFAMWDFLRKIIFT